MKPVLLFTLVTLALSRCTESDVSPVTDDTLLIRTGTSYGMCAGYCQNDYVFSGTRVTLTQNGTRTQVQSPARTCQSTISPADWDGLKAAANLDTFSSLPETRGCPDCADGGAEYVELQVGDRKHRVTFEAGMTIPGFEPLVDALRKQRQAFGDCN